MTAAPARTIAVGFQRWKARQLAPLLDQPVRPAHFVTDAAAAAALRPTAGDRLLVWGPRDPPALLALAQTSGATLVHVEDGFLRSVGLGSDLLPPRSLVFDRRGLHCDARRTSDLEVLLAHAEFDTALLARAARVRKAMLRHGLSKYNWAVPAPLHWPSSNRRAVLVAGQVPGDASLAFGGTGIADDAALLAAVRAVRPGAYIVYKPHPDVVSGNRRGRLSRRHALRHADHIETTAAIADCITAADEVHVMTSLVGFDALLRGAAVVTWGMPFYAGWGLTEDRAGLSPARDRRQRRLTLDQLVAGALLLYPTYWDPATGSETSCEAVIAALAAERDALHLAGRLDHLRHGPLRRHWRKLRAVWAGWRDAAPPHAPRDAAPPTAPAS